MDPDYGHKKFEQEIIEEMERTGKDLKTVLSEKLDSDTMILRVKNAKKLPRIHREVILEDLVALKNHNQMDSTNF
jgi:hypothetical protein